MPTNDTVSKLVALLRAGKTPIEIRAILPVNPPMVSYYRKRLGMPPFPRSRKGRILGDSASKRISALAMKRAGKTYQEIGRELGVSRQRAQQLVLLALPAVPKRDACDRCGKAGQTLHHHHIDYFKGTTETLCASCHGLRHPPVWARR